MENQRAFEKTVTRTVGVLIMMLAAFILFPARKVYAQSYALYVNNVQVTDENKDNVLGDAGESVKFDSASSTLTLNNASITEGYTYPDYYNPFTVGIYSNLSELTIKGSATISGVHTGILQMYSEGNLHIKGEGNGLNISGEYFGIRRITSKSYKIGNTVLGGKIIATCGEQTAISSWGTIEIENGSVITATADNQASIPNQYGLVSNRGSIVIHGGTVTAKGSKIGIGQYYTGDEEHTGNVDIEGGIVLATGDTYAINSYQSVNLKGGTVTANGGPIGINAGETISLGKGIKRISAKGTSKAVSSPSMTFEGNPMLITPSGGEYNGNDIVDSAGVEAKEVVIEPGPDFVAVTSVKLNISSKTLTKGKKVTLKATVSPTNATTKTVTYKSSNTKVATVDKNGVVTAVAKGTAKITATTKSGGKTATCTITVNNPVAVKSVKLNKTKASVEKGKTITLTATINPSNAANKDVTFTSSNKKIATVSKKGVVKGVKAGTVTITATTANGKKATCKVTVIIKTKSIKFAKKTVSVKKGKTVTTKVIFTPTNATNKEVTYKSSNTKIATVDKNGKVTAKKKGKVKITATSKENKKIKAECEVTVK